MRFVDRIIGEETVKFLVIEGVIVEKPEPVEVGDYTVRNCIVDLDVNGKTVRKTVGLWQSMEHAVLKDGTMVGDRLNEGDKCSVQIYTAGEYKGRGSMALPTIDFSFDDLLAEANLSLEESIGQAAPQQKAVNEPL